MDTPNQTPKTLLERLRSHRLTATFALLATLSLGILAGSLLTRNVSGKEQRVDSSDARPSLSPAQPPSPTASRIVKQVGPAVVNINTDSIPKQSPPAPRAARPAQPQSAEAMTTAQPGDMQDFLNRFFGGGGNGGQMR